MPATAVICELNPLHNGHLHIINIAKATAPTPVILVMSGNFTQRAGAAAFHKYARAKAAVESGADLVVELPFPYSSAGAEYFARAGVTIAEKLGADTLVFGSECANTDRLTAIAQALDSDEYVKLFQSLSAMDRASGAAVIRGRALKKLIPDYDDTAAPNDTLAVEYIRSVNRLAPSDSSDKIRCIPVKRIDTPSASTLRDVSVEERLPYVPAPCAEMMMNTPRADSALFYDVLWRSLRLSDGDLSGVAECSGGLGERLRNVACESTSAEEFFEACRTKRYTNSRITRAALFAFARVTPEQLSAPPAYTTLLAASPKGTAHLAELRKTSPIPILTKPADHSDLPPEAKEQYRLSVKMDELYALLIGESAGYFMKRSPYIGRAEH